MNDSGGALEQDLSNLITAVMVTHNSQEVVAKSVGGIADVINVIVSDNASLDGTKSLIRSSFPNVTLIELEENLGFGTANNVALKLVDTEFALLLNPDAVIDEKSLENLIIAARKYPDAGIIAPTLLDASGNIQHSYKNDVFAREKKGGKFFAPEGDICAQYASGAVMLLRMKAIETVGLFDSAIFMYYEDDDLCLRMYKHNFSVVVVKDAFAVHLQGKSSPTNSYYTYKKNNHMIWSRLYLESKYKGTRKAKILAYKQCCFHIAKTLLHLAVLNKKKALRSFARFMGGARFIFVQD